MIYTGLRFNNVKCAHHCCTKSLTRRFFCQGHDVVSLAQSMASLPAVHDQRALYELCANACPAMDCCIPMQSAPLRHETLSGDDGGPMLPVVCCMQDTHSLSRRSYL